MMTKPKISPKEWEETKKEYEEAIKARAAEVRRLKDEENWTFEQIGKHFKIKRQAAEQIYKQGR